MTSLIFVWVIVSNYIHKYSKNETTLSSGITNISIYINTQSVGFFRKSQYMVQSRQFDSNEMFNHYLDIDYTRIIPLVPSHS